MPFLSRSEGHLLICDGYSLGVPAQVRIELPVTFMKCIKEIRLDYEALSS